MSNFSVSINGNYLMYQKGYSPTIVEKIINDNNLNGLRVFAHLKEDRLDNLDFLKDYKFLKGLEIATIPDFNYEFLKSLTELRRLNLQNIGKNFIDLSEQKNLEYLSIQWRKGKITGLHNCNKLLEICLIDYNEDDLMLISNLKKLKRLKIKSASIKTLNGLSSFNYLEDLLLGNCSHLNSIVPINNMQFIRNIEIDSCTKIGDYDGLTNLPGLETLKLINCKKIKSLGFLRKFNNLNKVYLIGNCDVVDGDMTPIQNVKEVVYFPRKHYNIMIENEAQRNAMKNNMEIKSLLRS